MNKTIKKDWGSYRILHQEVNYTIKELTILPKKGLSNQRHFKRDEHWTIIKGTLSLKLEDSLYTFEMELKEKASVNIPAKVWHFPENKTDEEVIVIEVWIGNSNEADIERKPSTC